MAKRRRSKTKTSEQERKSTIQSAHKPRSFMRDALLGLLVACAILGMSEIALRFAGFASTTPSSEAGGTFTSGSPLFQVSHGVAKTAPGKLKFFNESEFTVAKTPGTYRVFCVGGSTTYGHPFDGRTSVPRWLEELLSASDPQRKFEVINAGGISYASYRIVPIVQECLAFQPDAIIVYMGHNEFLESRTYSDVKRRGAVLNRILSGAEKLAVYQALQSVLRPVLPTPTAALNAQTPAADRSLKPEVSAILDRSAGLDLYHRDEEFTHNVIAEFRENLQEIVRLCDTAHVPLIIVQPPSNLEDFSPFKSQHRKELTQAEQRDYDTELTQAAADIDHNPIKALEALGALEQRDPLYAHTLFYKGKALVALGKYEEAQRAFVQAKDLDVCPLRCISAIESAIQSVGGTAPAHLLRFSAALNSHIQRSGKTSGIPGAESFLDHVHPTIPAHQYLAELLLDHMVEKNLVTLPTILSPQRKQEVYARVMNALDNSFFAMRDLNLAKTLHWAGKKTEAKAALDRIARLPGENPEIHKMLGSYYVENGEIEQGIDEYKKAVLSSNQDPEMMYSLAAAYTRVGLRSAAMATYKKVMTSETFLPEAYANAATLFLEEGKPHEALDTLNPVIGAHKDVTALYGPYGLALAMTGDLLGAVPWMEKATLAEPKNPRLFYNLAGAYALLNRKQDALNSLNLAIDKGYSERAKISADDVFASLRDSPQFAKTLERLK